jgi:alpha-beta hydrolase superfamily lysophospholipase
MEITTKKVTFKSQELNLVGKLYRGATFSEDKQYTAVIVTGSWTTVKEQMPDLYAKRLAQHGFVAFAFDFRYFGESEGQPRNYENPPAKMEDICSAVDFIKSLPYIKHVVGVGICLSAGMMAAASIQHKDLEAVALIAPGLQDKQQLIAAFGSEAALQAKIDEGKAAQAKYKKTGETAYTPVVSLTDNRAAVVVPDESGYYLDPNRGAIAAWDNRFAVMSWAPFAEFDSVSIGNDIQKPLLMIHSENGANPDAAKRFYANIPTATKEVYWMPGTLYDFYDQELQVTKSVQAAGTFFRTSLPS